MKKMAILLLAGSLILTGLPAAHATVVKPPVAAGTEPSPELVKSALADFENLSRKEKKERIREVKNELKAFKAARKAGKESDTNTLLLVLVAILLPPLAVYLYEGEINNRFWIDLILTLLGWLPGVIYALVLILGKH